jgi:hypothetical protein
VNFVGQRRVREITHARQAMSMMSASVYWTIERPPSAFRREDLPLGFFCRMDQAIDDKAISHQLFRGIHDSLTSHEGKC